MVSVWDTTVIIVGVGVVVARSANESRAQIDVKQNESENTMKSPADPK